MAGRTGTAPSGTQGRAPGGHLTLPTDAGRLFITDGGMETTLIFRDGLELPEFASFVLLDDDAGVAALRRYYESYAHLASELAAGIVLDTPTWRASSDWGERPATTRLGSRMSTGAASRCYGNYVTVEEATRRS